MAENDITLTLSGLRRGGLPDDKASVAVRHPRALAAIESKHWMITQDGLRTILGVAVHGEGDDYRPGANRPEATSLIDVFSVEGRPAPEVRNGVGIMHVTGPIFPRGNIMTNNSGASSLRAVQSDFASLMNDPTVDRIVLAIDSPGGVADGIQAFAEQIFEARETKHITAVAQDFAASAALWIASAANEVVATPTAALGSIGVVLTAMRQRSDPDRIQIVSSQSPNKRQDPSSQEGRDALQAMVDSLAQVFVETVSRNRGVSVETVLSDFGRGGLLQASDAVRVGLVDRLGTVEQVVAGTAGTFSTESRSGDEKMSGTSAANTEITRELVAENHPDIAQALRDEGRDAAANDLRSEGAEQERARIRAVQDQSLPGHETLIHELMFDGVTTGEQAAVKVLQAERERGSATLETLRSESITPVEEPAPASPSLNDQAPLEERCKAKWDSDAQLRSEFADFESYVAYQGAEERGVVRRFQNKQAVEA